MAPRQIDALRGSDKFDKALEKARRLYLDTLSPTVQHSPGPLDAPMAAPMGIPLEGMAPMAGGPVDDALEGLRRGDPFEGPVQGALEAIILSEMRPAYFIEGDRIEVQGDFDRIDLLEANRDTLQQVCARVGRVDLLNHVTMDYAGTGWLVAKDIVVTNRHVAHVFATRDWLGDWRFGEGTFGNPLHVQVNTLRQQDPRGLPPRILLATEVLYVAPSGAPDIAFLRVANPEGLEPLSIATAMPEPGAPVAAVGYPARDGGRNDPDLMDRIFKGVYKVKRFSPGMITGAQSDGTLLLADYSSLGGNSGSVVLDLETGEAVGLHFAGAFREMNYAVAGDVVAAALRDVQGRLTAAAAPPPPTEEAPAESFDGRQGYDPDFLGADRQVPLPDLCDHASDLAPVQGRDDGHLDYTHFTVLQSASRRLPRVTAVNIDGEKALSLKRKGNWRLDGRLKPEHQIGNELYRRNPLDRGHMVRRKDPGWGDSRAEAQAAEQDTFHYTNCAPQHADLNQKDWVGLEDYILGSSTTRGFRVSVFTGPVFLPGDKQLREQPGAEDILIPESFWKVAVMINDDTGALSATGYLLTQGDMIRSLTEAAFVLGEYRTYQMKVSEIEAFTGLDFGPLRTHDPLRAEPESVFGRGVRPLDGPESLTL
ncbi:DNA/RNA non-specific endonuclease [Sagittula salina]|uniref:Serine protease n=1 Tax=Sagittula salina TaxID=2820268 RepID=A0A940MQG5_9RHOB|nr:DNA/RNA non-specific endonuclease [Sagittula salina]MBP0482217.1 DNA/RNA non-specific endonuclease [Sagittula salina]